MTEDEGTSSSPDATSSPADYLRNVDWTVYPSMLAVITGLLLPWGVATAAAVPWFTARHGEVINREPWLYDPLLDLVPDWAVALVVALFVMTLAVAWGAAVRIMADAASTGRSRPLSALARAIVGLPLTLVAFVPACAVGALVDVAVHTALSEPPAALRVAAYALPFALWPPLWYPTVATALRGWGFAAMGRGLHRSLFRPGWTTFRWVGTPFLTGCVLLGLIPTRWKVEAVGTIWVLAVLALAATAAILTTAALATSPSGTGEFQSPTRSWRAMASATVVLLLVIGSLAAPPMLYAELLDEGPWPTLRYYRADLPSEDSDVLENKLEFVLAPEDDVAVLGDYLCSDDANCTEPTGGSGEQYERDRVDGLRLQSGAIATSRVVDDSLRQLKLPSEYDDAPAGTVIVWDECLSDTACPNPAGRGNVVEPASQPDGDWSSLDWQDGTRAWAAYAGERDHFVTAVPSADDRATVLNLFSCQDARCSNISAAEIAQLDGSPLRHGVFPRRYYPDLVDIAVGANGAVHVTVHNPETAALTLFACSNRTCDDVSETAILPVSAASRAYLDNDERFSRVGASLEIAPDGTLLVAYRDPHDGAIRLHACADHRCDRSKTTELFGPGWQRLASGFALDSQGNPRLASIDVRRRRLVYVTCGDLLCRSAEHVTLGRYVTTPGWVELELDQRDRPWIAWHKPTSTGVGGSVQVVRCADTHCGLRHPD